MTKTKIYPDDLIRALVEYTQRQLGLGSQNVIGRVKQVCQINNHEDEPLFIVTIEAESEHNVRVLPVRKR